MDQDNKNIYIQTYLNLFVFDGSKTALFVSIHLHITQNVFVCFFVLRILPSSSIILNKYYGMSERNKGKGFGGHEPQDKHSKVSIQIEIFLNFLS
jgi:hypothetical protein